ncbi:DUF2075 domain-containing protein [Agrococcus baldri]|uniref:GIY-YIG domain-containing protein n=1 Tax=Agrococcus baldri TaxID=153730 RepID=A0AA87RA34_9MICO|nr:DUF2075 domain-containing protein [Agrococcus baldri]GEK79071.1 hypothetical protein ABA31_04220 [Agrococcus baldri]
MTSFSVESVPLRDEQLEIWSRANPRAANWPVVYTLTGGSSVYVGESLNMLGRAKQHRASPEKRGLETAHVVVDETFNKSACLDLESFLIRLFSGDGAFQVLNRNDGVIDADYYRRGDYQTTFAAVFDELRALGLFSRSIPQIENSDLFKLSPFKALTQEQAIAVEDILEGVFEDLGTDATSTSVVRGAPGTGKTVVAIFLVKLLVDIAAGRELEEASSDSLFSDFFAPGYGEVLEGIRIGLVIPQQSLRKSVENVFKKTPGLDPSMVLTPFQVGSSPEQFDLLIVDEAHRLSIRASQASGFQNRDFKRITESLFGSDDVSKTQLDWIRRKSRHQVLLLDEAQAIRPGDLPLETTTALVEEAGMAGRLYPLTSQMRIRSDEDYVGYVRAALNGNGTPRGFAGYDLRFFDDFGTMRSEILARDDEHGLARLVAGYAWPWNSQTDKAAFDVVIDGIELQWNQRIVDWISSPTSRDEVGSIHTVQGYDLNYAGVIIGPDVGVDPSSGNVVFRREKYFDKRGKRNNPTLGITYSDEDLLKLVINIYVVLLTRGIRGTYVYVVDPLLRDRLRPFFDRAHVSTAAS